MQKLSFTTSRTMLSQSLSNPGKVPLGFIAEHEITWHVPLVSPGELFWLHSLPACCPQLLMEQIGGGICIPGTVSARAHTPATTQ